MFVVSQTILDERAKVVDMLACRRSLRAYAISLCRNFDRADDLVQETYLRAYANLATFAPGTNMSAWMFTILRNHFRTEWRKRRREVEDVAGVLTGVDTGFDDSTIPAHLLAGGGELDFISRLDYEILMDCLERLPADQRQALTLVILHGHGYEDAAEIMGCPVGSIKSRVNRARTRLAAMMGGYGDGMRAEAPANSQAGCPEPTIEEELAWARLRTAGALDSFDTEGGTS